jgi:hypothetical protein
LRRHLIGILLAVLCLAFFWRDIFSIALQASLRWQLNCQIAFRKADWENGEIVLSDAALLDSSKEGSSFHVRADKIGIAFHLFQPTRQVHISFFRPHVTLLEGFSLHAPERKEAKWIQTVISAEEGSFEWHSCGKDPLAGRFSLKDNDALEMQIGDGFFTAHLIRMGDEKKVECSFDRMEIAPFAERIASLDWRGRLSGFLQVELDRWAPRSLTGRLFCEECAFSYESRQIRGGAAHLEWDGEHDFNQIGWKNWLERVLSFPDRMKVQFYGGYIERKESRLENLEGVFSSNCCWGLRWEITGPSFSWEGKGFSKSRSINWLESRWQLHDAAGLFKGEQLDPSRCRFTVELAADQEMMHLMQDLVPAEWPGRFESGRIKAHLEWEEANGFVAEWRVDRLEGKDLSLRGDGWAVRADETNASLHWQNERAGCEATLFLKGGSGEWGKISLSHVDGDCKIAAGVIESGSIRGSLDGLECEADIKGSLSQIAATARVKGPWSQYWFWRPVGSAQSQIVESQWMLDGDWNHFSLRARAHFSDAESIEARAIVHREKSRWMIAEGSLEGRRFDLSHLQPVFGLDCSGIADLTISYANCEAKIEGAGSNISIKTKAAELAVKELGEMEPFQAGIKAVWDESAREWTLQTSRFLGECTVRNQKIPFEGQMELSGSVLKICVVNGMMGNLQFAGEWQFCLEDQIPFSFIAQKLDGRLGELIGHPSVEGRIVCKDGDFCIRGDLLADPMSWQWDIKADVAGVRWGPIQDGKTTLIADSKEGLQECADLQGTLAVGGAHLPIRSSKIRKQDQGWEFDLSIEHRFWDVLRLAGTAEKKDNHIAITFDSAKSHILNEPLKISQCLFNGRGGFESLQLSWHLSWNSLLAAAPLLLEMKSSWAPFLLSPLEGDALLEINLSSGGTSNIRLQGDNVRYKGAPIPIYIGAQQKDHGWSIDRLQVGPFDACCQIAMEEGRWKIENGDLQWSDGLKSRFGGYLSAGRIELGVEPLSIEMQKVIAPFIHASIDGTMEGKGYLSLEWKNEWNLEADLDLRPSQMKSGPFLIDNAGPMQIHYSRSQGLLVRGLDLQIHKSDPDWPSLHGRIGLMQFDFERRHWVLQHSQVNLPADSLAQLLKKIKESHPLRTVLEALDAKHDMEFAADIDCASDFSSFSCSMKEGFIPFLGSVRHLQNVFVQMKKEGMIATLSALHQGHSLKMSALFEFQPKTWGRFVIEDEEHPLDSEERPLTIEWEIGPDRFFSLQSIEGVFNGIDASFHADGPGRLIGSARLQLGPLAEILPARIGKVFRDLKMGKGYELKGRLFYDPQHLSNTSFKGLLSGKNCELFGIQVRTLLSQIEANASRVHLFELKGSDAAGIIKINELIVRQEADGAWRISMPLFQLLEFRPSLLQKIGREIGSVGPLVVRELKVTHLQGKIDEPATMIASGEMNFINSFKREHTVFDLPSDFLGRIIGLDQELLIPVRGRLLFELKEGRVWLTDLVDAYSEGKRSKFFLVKEGQSPSIDLEGNLHIFVTMKQYVLFKITENFLLTIDGTIQTPSFHLQKKSKLLGLGVL